MVTVRDVIYFVITIAILLQVRLFIALPFVVSGESMRPTFETGDYIVVDQLTYRFEDPKRGDVVVFRYPNDPSKFFIKRIIGLPGEKVEVEDSKVTIYNEEHPKGLELTEPYIFYTRDDEVEVMLGEDEFYVLGDNRFSSSDSRIWGPLSRDMILGRAFVRLYPFNQLDTLPGNYTSYESNNLGTSTIPAPTNP